MDGPYDTRESGWRHNPAFLSLTLNSQLCSSRGFLQIISVRETGFVISGTSLKAVIICFFCSANCKNLRTNRFRCDESLLYYIFSAAAPVPTELVPALISILGAAFPGGGQAQNRHVDGFFFMCNG